MASRKQYLHIFGSDGYILTLESILSDAIERAYADRARRSANVSQSLGDYRGAIYKIVQLPPRRGRAD
jgi:hypothetical protein